MGKKSISHRAFLRITSAGAVSLSLFIPSAQLAQALHRPMRLKVKSQVHFKEIIPRCEKINYGAYLMELSSPPVDAQLVLKHLKTAKEYSESRRHIQGVAEKLGLSFGT